MSRLTKRSAIRQTNSAGIKSRTENATQIAVVGVVERSVDMADKSTVDKIVALTADAMTVNMLDVTTATQIGLAVAVVAETTSAKELDSAVALDTMTAAHALAHQLVSTPMSRTAVAAFVTPQDAARQALAVPVHLPHHAEALTLDAADGLQLLLPNTKDVCAPETQFPDHCQAPETLPAHSRLLQIFAHNLQAVRFLERLTQRRKPR
jgi:hypothetical protein